MVLEMSNFKPPKNKLDPVGTLEDVRRRVEEYEALVIAKDVEHNSLSRDRAFILSLIDSQNKTTDGDMWVVLDNAGLPDHVTIHKMMAHDHINDAIIKRIDASSWQIVKVRIVVE